MQILSPDRAPIKRWAKVRLWAGYLYILCAIIFAKSILSLAIAGFILVLIGAAVRLIASATLVKDTELVTHGIYSMTRNPLYLGSALVGFGFASMSSSIWIIGALVIVLIPIYIKMIKLEEKYLRDRYPESFPDYVKSIPAFFPDLTRIGNIRGTLDKSLLAKSHEIFSTGLFIMCSLILLLTHQTWLPG